MFFKKIKVNLMPSESKQIIEGFEYGYSLPYLSKKFGVDEEVLKDMYILESEKEKWGDRFYESKLAMEILSKYV